MTPDTPLELLELSYDRSDTPAAVVIDFVTRQCAGRLDGDAVVAITASLNRCPEAIVARARVRIGEQVNELIAGICTIAPEGEEGASPQPMVVGVAVDPLLRGRTIGSTLLRRGVERLRELIAERAERIGRLRGEIGDRADALLPPYVDPRIRIEAVTAGGRKLAEKVVCDGPQERGRPPRMREGYHDVDYHDFSPAFDPPF